MNYRPKTLADILGPGYRRRFNLPPYKELNPNVNLLHPGDVPPEAEKDALPPAETLVVDERLAAAISAVDSNEVPN